MIARTSMLRALVVEPSRARDVFVASFLVGASLPAWAAIAAGIVWRCVP